ncbi:hypothetical protein pb186bvf_002982 [Paramecium bursaria]
MIIMAILSIINGQRIIPSFKSLSQKEGYNEIKLSVQNFATTTIGLFTIVVSSQYNIPIICQTLTVSVDDTQMTTELVTSDCNRFSFYVYNTRTSYILMISSYYTYALSKQFDIDIVYQVGANSIYSVKKPLQGANLVMKDLNSYTDINVTGTTTNLYLSYTPQWYLLKSSYFQLQFYYRDFQIENANIIPFTSITPKCVGLEGINANIYCYIQGDSLYIQNVVNYQFVPSKVLNINSGFYYCLKHVFILIRNISFNYQPLKLIISLNLTSVQVINRLVNITKQHSLQITMIFYILGQAFLSIFQKTLFTIIPKIKLIPIENIIANPPLTQTGNQLQIASCLPNFLGENSLIRFIISTTNPDIVSIYDNLQLTLEDDEVAQQISQSDFQSIQIAPSLLAVAILSLKDSIVGMITDFQFVFTCNSNLPQNTYIIIELDDSLSLNGNLIPQGINNINISPNLIVNSQIIRLNGWSTNQQLTANISRTITIKNIQNPLYINKNLISYSVRIYQQDDKLHDSYTGYLSITLQQFKISIQSINYNQQITNSIQQLNIITQIQSNIIKGDQIKIIFTESDYDFKLLKSQVQCFIGSYQQICFMYKGFLLITSQGIFQDSLNIAIRNMVTPRTLKSTNLQIQLFRAGYQVAFSDIFVFRLTELNGFQSLKLNSYSVQQSSSIQYNFDSPNNHKLNHQ